jgi:hypothetical protein
VPTWKERCNLFVRAAATGLATLVVLLVSSSSLAGSSGPTASFQPAVGMTAIITSTRSAISYTIASSNGTATNSVPLAVESQPHVRVQDFNFDGHLDFEVWYVDEGMGRYTIHRVFVFKPESATFAEVSPSCGDEFLNLRVNKTKRRLISTYYVRNRAQLCSTRLGK